MTRSIHSLCISPTYRLNPPPRRRRQQQQRSLWRPARRHADAWQAVELLVGGGGGGGLTSLGVPTSALNPTLIDSGTTFFFASTPIWRALHSELKHHAPELHKHGPHHVCALMSDARRDELPTIRLTFASVGHPAVNATTSSTASSAAASAAATSSIRLTPRQYMVRYPTPGSSSGVSSSSKVPTFIDQRRLLEAGSEHRRGGRSGRNSKPRRHHHTITTTTIIAAAAAKATAKARLPPPRPRPRRLQLKAFGTTIARRSSTMARQEGRCLARRCSATGRCSSISLRGTISFVDAECERATPANAVLRGAFAFAPCSSSSGGGGNETLEPAPAAAVHDEMSPRDEQALPSWWRWVKAALPWVFSAGDEDLSPANA